MLKTIRLLLPALIPSWRFFDTIAPSPRIEFALLKTTQDAPTGWQEFRPRPGHMSLASMVRRLFCNPRWNETLYLVSCAERLMQHPTDHSAHDIVTRIQRELPTDGLPYVQFRLVLVSRQGEQLQRDITFTSPVYSASGGAAA